MFHCQITWKKRNETTVHRNFHLSNHHLKLLQLSSSPSWIFCSFVTRTFHETPETGEESGEWFPESVGVHKSSCDTVDGTNPAPHPGCIKPCWILDKLYLSADAGFLPSVCPREACLFFFIAQDFQTPPEIKTGFETLLSFCGVP